MCRYMLKEQNTTEIVITQQRAACTMSAERQRGLNKVEAASGDVQKKKAKSRKKVPEDNWRMQKKT